MAINIGSYRIIKRSSKNIVVELKYKKKVKPGDYPSDPRFDWKREGNFSSFEAACLHILDQKLAETDAEDLNELIEELKTAKTEIINAVKKESFRLVRVTTKFQSGTKAIL